MTQATLSGFDVPRIAAALGEAARTPYAPPHVYPMSAPTFVPEPEAPRPRPTGIDSGVTKPGSLGVYVHVPFCNYACNFCFYAKKIDENRALMERYTRAAIRELQWIEPGTPLSQLYFGGGTPTALPADLLDELLTTVFSRVHPDGGGAVHTVECSPESFTAEHIAVLDTHGIERMSMGIQTLDEKVLHTVNRLHSAQTALDAIDRLVATGKIINIDLIYGLPGQTEERFRDDFRRVTERGINSVTCYNLRINEQTPVVRELKESERLDLDRLLRWRQVVVQTAADNGFVHKTGHTFERPTEKSRRFSDLTAHGDQFGAGPSARSRIDHTVYRNHSNLQEYLDRVERGASPVQEVFPFDETRRRTRFVALTLGVNRPLSRAAYHARFGVDFDQEFGDSLHRFCDAGLVEDRGDSITLSETGTLLYDLTTLAFYPTAIQTWLDERYEAALTKRKPRKQAAEV